MKKRISMLLLGALSLVVMAQAGLYMSRLWSGNTSVAPAGAPALTADGDEEEAGALPEFSTVAAPVWYTLEFKKGGNYVTDKGDGAVMQTAAGTSSPEQTWQFIGTATNFVMRNKAGRYAAWNTSSSRFTATSDSTAAVTCKFKELADGVSVEIQRTAVSAKGMNQFGGAGAGKQLGEWNEGDGGNALYLNLVEEVVSEVIDPVFSDDTNETWMIIRFSNGKNVMMAGANGEKAALAAIGKSDNKLWKFVGTASNFQLVSKSGLYATIKQGVAENGQTGKLVFMQTTPDANGFSIMQSTHATYTSAYEIQYNGETSNKNHLNEWGGTQVGRSVGLWTAGADNDPFELVNPDAIAVPFAVTGTTTYTPTNPLTLWYKLPASSTTASDKWMEYSLPIGNGQLGASIFGGVMKEEVQFNEKTLWSGRNTDNSSDYGDYENFGSLFIEDLSGLFGSETATAVKDYYRQLDLTNATASVHFKSPDESVTFTREYIVSNPDNVIAMRLTADQPGQVSLRITVAPGRPGIRATPSYSNGGGHFKGKLETVSYDSRFRVIPTGGTMTTDTKDGITVTGANEVMIVMTGATDFDPYSATYVSNTQNLASRVQTLVDNAAAKSWDEIYEAHVADYQSIFNRVEFTLDGMQNNLPTDDLIKRYANRSTGREDYALMLENLYFNYGRYLEISSSRGVDLPSNLQGIWNNSSEPAWNADIHSNINVQMNYWPAEPTNMSELHLPFLNYIINMATNHNEWASYARAAGQTKGWTCYTENNIFGGVGSFAHNYVIANAWYCSHLWQHYRYTLDRAFLQRAFPAMWSCSQFWLERLKLDTDGTYVCPREYSPEHGPGAEDGVAHAQQLVLELFSNTLAAADILGDDCSLAESDRTFLSNRLDSLDRGLAKEVYTGQWGNPKNGVATGDTLLREWKTSAYTAGQNGHRHMSHLMCLYPFSQITPSSPYFQAAVNSMKLRSDASTGWSMGWKINLWARAHDGNHAHTILELALRHHSVGGGGVYYNLYDAHTPFQIDGNFGACAGIAEMLMQSCTDTIYLLPALPSVWQAGTIRGLKAVGDFTVDVAWSEGKATEASITSNQGQPLSVVYPGVARCKVRVDGVETEVTRLDDNTIVIPASTGQTAVISFGEVAVSVKHPSLKERGGYTVSGRTITALGDGVKALRVYDTDGKLLARSNSSSVTVRPGTGKVVLLEVVGDRKPLRSYKVSL